MRIVLLSGGSGKRMWPLSNEVRSKIFLRLLPGPNGSAESTLQRLCRQLGEVGLLSSLMVVTHRSQADLTARHAGSGVTILTEPFKRGTYHAAALAAGYMHAHLRADPEEMVCVLPSDLYADGAFFEHIARLPLALQHSGAELALLGVRPSEASTQYGYIVPREGSQGEEPWYTVERFKEKPDESTAKALISRHALWNCGIFAFKLGYLLQHMQNRKLPEDHTELLGLYEALPELSFDQEVVEPAQHRVVLPYAGDWSDLGSWESLTARLGGTIIGKGSISGSSEGTHLVNELTVPVHVVDVPDAVVAAGPDGILVSRKASSSRIKSILPAVPNRAMYEEQHWGSSLVLDISGAAKAGTEGVLAPTAVTKKLELMAGQTISCHMHRLRKEILVILTGSGEVLQDGIVTPIEPGAVVEIPPGSGHAIRTDSGLVILEIQQGAAVEETDSFPLAETWQAAIALYRKPEAPPSS